MTTTYRVVVSEGAVNKEVQIEATDVELNGEENGAPYFNFYLDREDEDSITVAAIPFDNVKHITS